MTCSVASVTVAYNSAHVLPRQIDALLRQSRPLDEIVVVDNASSDGTPELLARRYPRVKVIKMSENVGAGGAVASGMAYAAMERKHDWVWIFDDDSIPRDDTLESLLNGLDTYTGCDDGIGLAASLAVHPESGTYYKPLFWRDGFVAVPAGMLRHPVFFPDLVITSGCMVRREVVERIGVPRADFFMAFIDFEYCLRARKSGYKVAVVTGAKLDHEVGHARTIRLPGFPKVWPIHAPWHEYYMGRNLVYAAWHLYSNAKTKAFALRHLARHAVGVVLFSPDKIACLTKMAQGFADGRRGRLGVRFQLG